MGYINAEEILPIELIEEIWQYVDGENIYIPRKTDNRQEWGAGTRIKQEPALSRSYTFAISRFLKVILKEKRLLILLQSIICRRRAYSVLLGR